MKQYNTEAWTESSGSEKKQTLTDEHRSTSCYARAGRWHG